MKSDLPRIGDVYTLAAVVSVDLNFIGTGNNAIQFLVSSNNLNRRGKVIVTGEILNSHRYYDMIRTRRLSISLFWQANFGKSSSSFTYWTCGITSILWRCRSLR